MSLDLLKLHLSPKLDFHVKSIANILRILEFLQNSIWHSLFRIYVFGRCMHFWMVTRSSWPSVIIFRLIKCPSFGSNSNCYATVLHINILIEWMVGSGASSETKATNTNLFELCTVSKTLISWVQVTHQSAFYLAHHTVFVLHAWSPCDIVIWLSHMCSWLMYSRSFVHYLLPSLSLLFHWLW